MAPTNEAQVVAAIVRAIKRRYPDAWVFKVVGHPYQETGVPDLVMSVEGCFIGLEVKHQRPGESVDTALSRATPRQQYQISKINKSGGYAAVVLDVDSALVAIAHALAAHTPLTNEGD